VGIYPDADHATRRVRACRYTPVAERFAGRKSQSVRAAGLLHSSPSGAGYLHTQLLGIGEKIEIDVIVADCMPYLTHVRGLGSRAKIDSARQILPTVQPKPIISAAKVSQNQFSMKIPVNSNKHSYAQALLRFWQRSRYHSTTTSMQDILNLRSHDLLGHFFDELHRGSP